MELDWGKYIAVAERFQHKARREDREDLKQDIIVRLADVARNNGHEPFNEGAMVRVASYVVMAYWRDLMRKPTLLSLSKTTEDEDGNGTELWETLADAQAVDLDAWVDARTWLLGCPKRLVQIAYKRSGGIPLNRKDRDYLSYWKAKEQQKRQKVLF